MSYVRIHDRHGPGPGHLRYAETPYDQMTSEQQEGFGILAKAEGGELQGPAKIWVDNPNLAKAVAPLADHFHPPNHSLTQREREIAVCVMLGKWHAPFPINAHNRVAIELAISPEVVDALLCGQPTRLEDQREQTVYELATALAAGRYIPRASTTARSRSSVMTGSRTSPS
jgi:4-carboxymuconolactone decarboxylase